MEEEKPKRGAIPAILAEIRNPLVFFGLALLLVELAIGAIIYSSDMTGTERLIGVGMMAFTLLCIVVVVSWITVKYPGHLYEQLIHKLDKARYTDEILCSGAFADRVNEILNQRERAHNTRDHE